MRELAVWLVVGARPNFVKAAPVWRALHAEPSLAVRIVHAGQHYDERLSSLFFRDLELPDPDFRLDVGSATHAEQTAEVTRRLGPLLLSERPAVVVVFESRRPDRDELVRIMERRRCTTRLREDGYEAWACPGDGAVSRESPRDAFASRRSRSSRLEVTMRTGT